MTMNLWITGTKLRSFVSLLMSSKIIKMLKVSLTKSITLIINQMLNIGIFLDRLKTAKIIPIYKKETQFTKHRPISLLPTISKLFEKVIFKQIHSFFSRMENVL